jgi:hypothetical protein
MIPTNDENKRTQRTESWRLKQGVYTFHVTVVKQIYTAFLQKGHQSREDIMIEKAAHENHIQKVLLHVDAIEKEITPKIFFIRSGAESKQERQVFIAMSIK